MMGWSTKVSFHESGQCQWSMTSEWKAKNQPTSPNQARHILKWTRPHPLPNRAARVFCIVVPETELRPISAPEDLQKVQWLPPPATGHAMNVECYITPVVKGEFTDLPYAHLATLSLTSGACFVALYHTAPMSDKQLLNLRIFRGGAAAQFGGPPPPEYRGVGVFRDGEGVYGMTEFVPAGGEAA